jgi:1,4-alpha-glucan branching enzyme
MTKLAERGNGTLKRASQKRPSRKGKRSSRRKRVIFQVEVTEGSCVHVAGTFNDWDPEQHRLSPSVNGTHRAAILMPKGTHEYKFIVNGVWCVDSTCPDWVPNGLGSLNSVMHII